MIDRTPSEEDQDMLYQKLAAGTAEERAMLVLQLLEEHPDGRLELPACDGTTAVLNGIDLSAEALHVHGSRGKEIGRGSVRNLTASI